MCMKKYLFTPIICILCILSLMCVTVNADKNTAEEASNAAEALVMSNDRFEFFLDRETGCFTLYDKKSDNKWSSNPNNSDDDPVAMGITLTDLKSQLTVLYESSNRTEMFANSFSGSVIKGNAVFTKEGNSITALFDFDSLGFSVPIRYTLLNDGFSVSVDLKNIKEKKDNKIISIGVLPYFGAGTADDKGYMVIPDGSGALIDFNNQKKHLQSYSKPFYGNDRTVTSDKMTSDEKNLMLPVFGLNNNNRSFIAIIGSGAENASLNAAVGGIDTAYNHIYSSLNYRNSTQIEMKDNSWTTKSVTFTSINGIKNDAYTVDYYMLDTEKSDYVGMAEKAREVLNLSSGKKSGNSSLGIRFFGATPKQKSFLGFRYTGKQKLTTFAQAEEIIKEISDYASAPEVTLKDFTSEEFSDRTAVKFSFLYELGGENGYKKLCNTVNKLNGNIGVYSDFTDFSKNGNGFRSTGGVNFGLDLKIAEVYPYKINTALKDETKKPTYLVDSKKYSYATSMIEKYASKRNIKGIYFDEVANSLSSDFRKTGNRRSEALSEAEKSLKSISENYRLTLSAPNCYALKYSEKIIDIPVSSSGYKIFDRDIPLYQIIVGEGFDFIGEPVNIGEYSKARLLSNIEYGVNLNFALMNSPSSAISKTDCDYLYHASFDSIKSDIKEWYLKSAAVIDKIGKSYIIGHEVKDELSVTTYKNGLKIYVNYGKHNLEIDGLNIPAEDFVLV